MVSQTENYAQNVYLNLPQALIKEHVICKLGDKFDLSANIKGAKIVDDFGLVAVEFIGGKAEIQRALKWLTGRGAKVESSDMGSLQSH